MAIMLHVPPSLYEALKAEGFWLPPNCGDLELEMPVDGLWVLKYRQMLEPEDIAKVGRAFQRVASKEGSSLGGASSDLK